MRCPRRQDTKEIHRRPDVALNGRVRLVGTRGRALLDERRKMDDDRRVFPARTHLVEGQAIAEVSSDHCYTGNRHGSAARCRIHPPSRLSEAPNQVETEESAGTSDEDRWRRHHR